MFNKLNPGKKTMQRGFGEEFFDECFQRSAAAFDGDPLECRSHYYDNVSFVKAHYVKNEADGICVAWITSINRAGGCSLNTSNIFRKVLHALQAWDGFTSSECERGFDKAQIITGKHRECLNGVDHGRGIKLVMDVSATMRETAIEDAQVIWLKYWGTVRESGESRSNFYKKRAVPDDCETGKTTEAAYCWLPRQRSMCKQMLL